ncbi:hypothetical protein ONS95_007477 [Cadophora gregata]|uniref:uncharacterized protein n=1 Tax=Cadophora gregata TaxID=51156 RepID=UPI0026DB1B62|nr:uncharacterized protein ONS95_007477 [Cadophora gregata]KAK0118592.1 hypothetical protein ONS96_011684 [Cadophora gregata f. sp. sojae]KAK0125846.1 hypothetical protein ONS95_007477 [Cadophora gregata]
MHSRNLLFLWASLSFVRKVLSQNAYSVTLPSEVSSFLPACAQPCLKSSVEQQFPESKCSSTPTLNCLCSATSNSGDTLGVLSGACINFGIRDGLCTGVDAVPTARQNAFKLCSAVQSGSSATVPSTARTVTSSTPFNLQTASTIPSPISSGSQSTLLPFSTSQSSTLVLSGTTSITPQLLSPTSSTSTAPSPISTSTTKITTAEQVGIGIGVTLGGLIVALLGAIIFLIMRRRKNMDGRKYRQPETLQQRYKRERLEVAEKVLELDSTSVVAELGPDLPHEIEGRNVEGKSKRKSKTWSVWVLGFQDRSAQAIELDTTSFADRRR